MSQGISSDAELVVKARSGSDAAFAQLVDRHQCAVRNFLRKITPYAEEADDLAQESFLAAWQSLTKLESGDRFLFWLMGIAWNKAKTRARSAARSRSRDHEWQESQDAATNPNTEMALALHQAMGQLSADQQAAVALCLGTGWSHPDAAATLNMPLGTLKSHVSRGRARLAEILEVSDDG